MSLVQVKLRQNEARRNVACVQLFYSKMMRHHTSRVHNEMVIIIVLYQNRSKEHFLRGKLE